MAVFTDDMTGGMTARPGMLSMLAVLSAQKRETVVIIDDISRLARSLQAHFGVKRH